MATIQKFKLFATQCAAVNIPTQSPTTSPLLDLRRPSTRRKMLRMLFLTRRTQISSNNYRRQLPPTTNHEDQKKKNSSRLKLRDFFFSGSADAGTDEDELDSCREKIEPVDGAGGRCGSRPVRPVVRQPLRFRNRLLMRKAWRPVLTPIDEIQD